MERRYISAVKPLDGFVPQVWNSAVTNGIFVRFGNVELNHDEILSMAEQEHGNTTD